MTQPSETPPLQAAPTRRSRLRAFALIGLMIAFSLALLQVDFAALGDYGYLGLFLLVLLGNATVIVPAPAFVAAFAAGRTLNPWLVGLVSGLGAGLGETTGYLVGRAGRSAFGENPRFARISQQVKRWGAFAVFFFAAIPNPLMDVAGMAAGVLRLPFWKYLLACCAGKILRFTVLALLGHYGWR
jgi:membrane protein YqaA with SNARE-associated domain